jgi:hypothetical protein
MMLSKEGLRHCDIETLPEALLTGTELMAQRTPTAMSRNPQVAYHDVHWVGTGLSPRRDNTVQATDICPACSANRQLVAEPNLCSL